MAGKRIKDCGRKPEEVGFVEKMETLRRQLYLSIIYIRNHPRSGWPGFFRRLLCSKRKKCRYENRSKNAQDRNDDTYQCQDTNKLPERFLVGDGIAKLDGVACF